MSKKQNLRFSEDSGGNGKKAYQESVLALMQLKSRLYGERLVLSLYEDHHWKELTYAELSRKARNLSDYLIEKGFQQGERIAILSESRPEWGIAFFAAIRSGGIVVPLDTKWTPTELALILSDAEPSLLFVSFQFLEVAKILKTRLPFLKGIILINEGKTAEDFPSIGCLQIPYAIEVKDRELDETALIVYTSGTTGNPKGVMITFRNLISQIKSFEILMRLNPKDLFLSILPLNHLLELTVGFLGVLYAGGRICYCHSLYPQDIAQIMREKKVTLMITVPLFLKILKGSIEKEVQRSGTLQKRLFQVAFRIARWVPVHFLKKFLFYKVHKQFGGRLRAFISGGAPLDPEVATFFDRLGCPIYQGYGLTETSPVISVNTPQYNRSGSVGKPLSNVRVQIVSNGTSEPEGEILTQGPHVMKGYYKREDLTREVMDAEGWFHTGDLGRLDEDGFLYLTGRIKNLIVLGGGKKVYPEEVEAALSKSPMIKEVCVVGRTLEGIEEVCVVIVPTIQSVPMEKVEEEIQKEMAHLLQNLAPYKHPSRIFIRFEELPKTATRKIRRTLVLEWLMGIRNNEQLTTDNGQQTNE